MTTMLTKSQELVLELTTNLRVFDCSLGKGGEITSNTKEHGKKIYDKSLFGCSDYLEIKQKFLGLINSNPYNWKIELEEGLEVIKDYQFRYNPNSCSWEFDRIRQKHWMDGFSEKEREKIKKILNTRQENSQNLKKEILNNLFSWSINSWIFNDKEKIYLHNGIKERAGAFWYKDGWSGKELSREDYQEVRSALSKNIIDRVKQNPHEWRIQNVCVFNGDRPDFKYMGGYQEWEEKLIHYSISSQYEWEWENNFEKQKKKVFARKAFSNEEWTEIENSLNHNKELDEENTNQKKVRDNNYNDLTQKELNKEIEELKSEIEELKTNQNINNSERQIELKKREEKLEKLKKARSNSTQKTKSGNGFPTGWVIGGGILAFAVLAIVLAIRNHRKKKI